MPFLSQRRHRGPGRFLAWKIRLFSVGAVVLLVGMARELDLLVFAGIALLAIAFILRFFEKEPEEEEPADEDGWADEEPPPEAAPPEDAPVR